ncbi:MAG: nitrous oxide-stimulated promoter family protein [Bacteroidetes bacterium]|nr:nitrous oxide-stimulated promoter family protein [Bacteroidota bacterium]
MNKGNLTEKKTISAMIRVYCRSVHGSRIVCRQCRDLEDYAHKRVDHCIYGQDKPACKQCPVHCYSPLKREEIKTVMREAGPRMMLRHPVLSLKHFIREWKRMSDIGYQISDI